MNVKYPFVPKSTSYLEPGQFWAVPLSNGKFACGVVLQLMYVEGKLYRSAFLAGLLNWSGSNLPSENDIKDNEIIEHGQAHIKIIGGHGGEILGKVNWEDSKLQIPLTLSESPGRNCRLQRGYEILNKASSSQQKTLEVFEAWGFRIICLLAEKHFVNVA